MKKPRTSARGKLAAQSGLATAYAASAPARTDAGIFLGHAKAGIKLSAHLNAQGFPDRTAKVLPNGSVLPLWLLAELCSGRSRQAQRKSASDCNGGKRLFHARFSFGWHAKVRRLNVTKHWGIISIVENAGAASDAGP